LVQASGQWVNNRTPGLQFRADTAEGIEKYLASALIRGIGPVYPKKLVRASGETVFEDIEQTPARQYFQFSFLSASAALTIEVQRAPASISIPMPT
jgi:hypothetical protein